MFLSRKRRWSMFSFNESLKFQKNEQKKKKPKHSDFCFASFLIVCGSLMAANELMVRKELQINTELVLCHLVLTATYGSLTKNLV